MTASNAAANGASPHFIFWQGDLHDGNNIASIQLTAGQGRFAGSEPSPATLMLGDELNFQTCGVCVAVATYNSDRSGFISYYIATTGNVSFEAVPPPSGEGRFAGTLDGAKLVHVITVDGQPTNILDPSCMTTIDHMSFDVIATAM